MHRIDRMEVRSFGECIYCGALGTDVELTDEHIIPLSLGGKAVILDGSCKACAKETTKLENEIAHKVLWEFRAHVKRQLVARKSDRKSCHSPIPFQEAKSKRRRCRSRITHSSSRCPVWVVHCVPIGKQTTTEFEHYKAHVFYSVPANIKETLGARKWSLSRNSIPGISHRPRSLCARHRKDCVLRRGGAVWLA
jgi:hypothetical protein